MEQLCRGEGSFQDVFDFVILAKNDADLPTAGGSREVRTSLVNTLKRWTNELGPGIPRLGAAMSAV